MKKEKWMFICFLLIAIIPLIVIALIDADVDPYFHYRAPKTDQYFYRLDNERAQNDGIIKHFDYDAILTGTSMIQTSKTSLMDELFDTHAIKVPSSGATFSEINNYVCDAIISNPDLKVVIRGLDMNNFLDDKDKMREDMGTYPTYLYDDNVLNDIKYVLNRDVFWGRTLPMLLEQKTPGITSFDEYSNWMGQYPFGFDAVCTGKVTAPDTSKEKHLSDREKARLIGNIQQNVTSLANGNPDITFYYFFPPYSIIWWRNQVDTGLIYKQVEAEKIVIEEILKSDNIKLFSFNNLTEITTNLDNYMDHAHHGDWINDMIMQYMHDGTCLLTKDNYKYYLEYELAFYKGFDYTSLNKQSKR